MSDETPELVSSDLTDCGAFLRNGIVNRWVAVREKTLEMQSVLTPQFAENNAATIDTINAKLKNTIRVLIEFHESEYQNKLDAFLKEFVAAVKTQPSEVVTLKMEADIVAKIGLLANDAIEAVAIENTRLIKLKPSELIDVLEQASLTRKSFVSLVMSAFKLTARLWIVSVKEFIDAKRKEKDLNERGVLSDEELAKVGHMLFSNGEPGKYGQVVRSKMLARSLGLSSTDAELPEKLLTHPMFDAMILVQRFTFHAFEQTMESRLQPIADQCAPFAAALDIADYKLPQLENARHISAFTNGLAILEDSDKSKKFAQITTQLDKLVAAHGEFLELHHFELQSKMSSAAHDTTVTMTGQFVALAPRLMDAVACIFEFQQTRGQTIQQKRVLVAQLDDRIKDAGFVDELIQFFNGVLKKSFADDAHAILEFKEMVSHLVDGANVMFPREGPLSKASTMVQNHPLNCKLRIFVDHLASLVVDETHDLIKWYCDQYTDFAEIGAQRAKMAMDGCMALLNGKKAPQVDGPKCLQYATEDGNVRIAKEAWLALRASYIIFIIYYLYLFMLWPSAKHTNIL